MNNPSQRALRFAVTGALLAGAVGCTDDPKIYSNPGPVPLPASPTPGASPAASPAAEPSTSPAAEPSPSPAQAPSPSPAETPPKKQPPILTNPGPDRQ